MSDTEYGAALKLGKKQYQDAVAKGEYPYLPVLDDVLSYTDIVSTVSLGTMDIPLAKLVGTKTAERSNSFANNFMPLLPERSEFGIKWLNLYNHQVEDGIQDPIVAYEFMNRFYVQATSTICKICLRTHCTRMIISTQCLNRCSSVS